MHLKVALVCFRHGSFVSFAALSVTVCYISANVIPVCKQVEFTVTLTQQEAKVLLTHHGTCTVNRTSNNPMCVCARADFHCGHTASRGHLQQSREGLLA